MRRQTDTNNNGNILGYYVIFKDEYGTYARNGVTRQIDFKGTDAATVMLSAMNVMPPGSRMFIRNGIYDMNRTFIYNKDKIVIEGEGHGTILRLANGANIDVLSAGRRNNAGIIIRNLAIDGNNAYNTSGRGLVFTGYYSVIDNIYISNCAENGFDAEIPVGVGESMVDNFIHNIRVVSCGGTGFIWGTQTGGNSSDNYIQNLVSWNNGNDGVDFVTGAGITVDMLHSYGNNGNGVIIRGSFARMINSASEYNHKNGFWIYRHGAWNTVLIACASWNNSIINTGTYHGFYIDGDGIFTTGRCMLMDCITYDDQATKTQGWGIKTNYQTALTRNVVIGGTFDGNLNGAIDMTDQLKVSCINSPLYENKGMLTASGTGIQKQFVIPHGLTTVPTNVLFGAKTSDATGDKYWTADAINIVVNFMAAPPPGINNIVLNWKADV